MADKKKKTGSPFVDNQVAAGKKAKRPKDYKPMSTAEKLWLGTSFVGGGEVVGAIKGVKAAKAVREAAKDAKPYVRVSTGVHAKNANVTLKSPKSTKAGSPKPGTKAKIQRVVNPRNGVEGRASAASKAAAKTAKSAGKAASLYAPTYQLGKANQRDSDRKTTKKKK